MRTLLIRCAWGSSTDIVVSLGGIGARVDATWPQRPICDDPPEEDDEAASPRITGPPTRRSKMPYLAAATRPRGRRAGGSAAASAETARTGCGRESGARARP